MIELKNINIHYDNKECIRKGHFIAYPNQITGLYGESGTGKSSLLYMIAMLSNQQCDYYYNNEELTLNNKEKQDFRNQYISYITQDSLLIETITVEKNIEYFIMQSDLKYSVDELLKEIKLEDKRKVYPKSLSGGERQRVALACAIANNSSIIIGDEITASLDDENKAIVMDLLKKQSREGKIIILVSHEKEILNQCDRLYELDHLELKLKKEQTVNKLSEFKTQRRKVNIKKMYKTLFYEKKRNKFSILFIILITLFVGASIVRNTDDSSRGLAFTLDGLANNKILVLNNEEGVFSDHDYGVAIRSIVWYDAILPLNESDVKTIGNLDHVNKIYPYYAFMSKHRNAMNVYRNGEIVEMNKDAADEWNSSIPDYYVAVPIYKEELSEFKEGIYVCPNTAKKYNLLPGDDVELFLEIPVAISDCIDPYYDEKNEVYVGGDSYLTTLVKHKTKVIDIMESNSHQPEIYMRYEDMEMLFQQQMERYENGEIQVSVDNTYNEHVQIDYYPSAFAVFVDKYENILNVMNNIKKQTTDTFVYSEYLAMQDIIEETKEIYKDSMIIGIISSLFFVIGAFLIFVIYVSRNKSAYMMLRLSGQSHMTINKIMLMHSLELIISMLFMCTFIYITASMPTILPALNIKTYEEIIINMNELYHSYYAYFRFTILHFIILVSSMIFVIIGGYSVLLYRYKKQSITMWMRGE